MVLGLYLKSCYLKTLEKTIGDFIYKAQLSNMTLDFMEFIKTAIYES